MKYLTLAGIMLLGFCITAIAAPIEFSSGPSSVLPAGARIVAGDLSKNEFFILSANENVTSDKPQPTTASSSTVSDDKQIVSELKTALNKTFKPQVAPNVSTDTHVAQKNKPIMQITIHSHVIALHKPALKQIHHVIAANKPHKISHDKKVAVAKAHGKKVAIAKVSQQKKVAIAKVSQQKKVAIVKVSHAKKVAVIKINYKKLANAFSQKQKMVVDKRTIPHSLADADQFIKHLSVKKNAKVKVAMGKGERSKTV